MVIYRATNKVNGKMYIGQTKRELSIRINEHINDALLGKYNFWFHKAIKKYGHNNFEWDILCECLSPHDLNDKEIYYVDLYDTYNKGYNMTKGGHSSVEMTNEIRVKISKSIRDYYKNNPVSIEFRQKISERFKGKPKSYNQIQKMKENHVGMKGKTHTDITKLKISESMIGENNHFYGKHHSDETKQVLKDKGIRCESRTKVYKITNPDGDILIVRNLRNFCRENNLTRELMNQVIWGKQKHHKGYKCEYYKDNKEG